MEVSAAFGSSCGNNNWVSFHAYYVIKFPHEYDCINMKYNNYSFSTVLWGTALDTWTTESTHFLSNFSNSSEYKIDILSIHNLNQIKINKKFSMLL